LPEGLLNVGETASASTASNAARHLGELVQMDGSHHDWFEGRRGWAVVEEMIDDATEGTARFYGNDRRRRRRIVQRYARRHGLPRGLHVDQHGIYRRRRADRRGFAR
jgi:hypothetical protein